MNAVAVELESLQAVTSELGLEKAIKEIDAATEGMTPDEYLSWLEDHPEAKEVLVKINKFRDNQLQNKKVGVC
ncbi:hypothetical protein KBC89_00755 [Candidatus Woesebacteria bacterium]|nr:hypothetical protein [Candidatus Woesebacteria bacterium]